MLKKCIKSSKNLCCNSDPDVGVADDPVQALVNLGFILVNESSIDSVSDVMI